MGEWNKEYYSAKCISKRDLPSSLRDLPSSFDGQIVSLHFQTVNFYGFLPSVIIILYGT